MQQGELDKAQMMLHLALKMAQDLNHFDGITFIYDQLANLAFDKVINSSLSRSDLEVTQTITSGHCWWSTPLDTAATIYYGL